MGIGNNIKEQRTRLGLTQKDIADRLNVTAQAVSRWENEEVEPSIDTLKRLSCIFKVSLDVLLNDQATTVNNEVAAEVVPQEVRSNEPQGVCDRCKRLYPKSKLESVSSRVGRHTRHYIFCQECLRNYREDNRRERARKAAEHERKVRFRRILGYILGAVALAICMGIGTYAALSTEHYSNFAIYGVIGLCAYFIIACALLGDNLVTNCFTTIAGFGIKFPGIIFTLDLDGIIFFILVKVLFGVLSLILTVLAFIAACLLSGALAIVYYPYLLVISYKHPEDIDFD